MTDVQLEHAIARLAPQVDDTPSWDDVTRRAGNGPSVTRRLVAATAALVLTIGVAGGFAEGIFSGSFDRMSGWLGLQPGDPAPEEQAAFDKENAASFAHFPTGTRVGRLLDFKFRGQAHEMLGFRDGSNLCIRIVPPLFPKTVAVPECVPRAELARLREPVAVVGSHVRTPVGDGSAETILYGLAADGIDRLEARIRSRSLGTTSVLHNAYFLAAPDKPHSAHDRPRDDPDVMLRAHAGDKAVDVRVPVFSNFKRLEPEDLPGPADVKQGLTWGSIGWLEHRTPRGEPFTWPYDRPKQVFYSRMVAPDPGSSFRLALAYGRDPDIRGRTYCWAWLWPLVPESLSGRSCGGASLAGSGVAIEGALQAAGGFPHWVGLAADEVSRLEVFYDDGSTRPIPVHDNVFSFFTVAGQQFKLVSYDHWGRVVGIYVLG